MKRTKEWWHSLTGYERCELWHLEHAPSLGRNTWVGRKRMRYMRRPSGKWDKVLGIREDILCAILVAFALGVATGLTLADKQQSQYILQPRGEN